MRRYCLPMLLISLTAIGAAASPQKCAQIFYDRVPEQKPDYTFGRTHAMMLQNLLGHFPNIQQIVSPIELYQKGDIEKCHTTFYLGTNYRAKIPKAWYEDYAQTKKQVVWAGYNVWNLGAEKLAELWNVKFQGLSTLDPTLVDAKGRPEFFRYYLYKHETFVKYGEFDVNNPKRFNAAFEISLFDLIDKRSDETVVSWARHSRTGYDTPYILRRRNHWYIGDSPFSFITEDDRYLIFADCLFDMLDEKPRLPPGKKPAIFRLEDVHPKVAIWQLYKMTDMLDRLKVPFSLTIVPIFADPLSAATSNPRNKWVLITSNRPFLDWIEYAKARHATFIFHGVSHQAGMMKNPWTATTGDDFEFWDKIRNRPMAQDSPNWVVNRVEDGYTLLSQAKATPAAWLTPHYQASPLDYLIFGQMFRWNMGRIIYFPFTQVHEPQSLPPDLTFDRAGMAGRGKRLPYFRNWKVTYPENLLPTGQFYPFEIYGDVYGQRLIPENLGNVQPYMNEQVMRTLVINDLIRTMKRNRVLRDSWGSFFVHPFEIEDTTHEGVGKFPGDTAQIEKLIKAAREYGYEFIDLKSGIRRASLLKRPEPIERVISH